MKPCNNCGARKEETEFALDRQRVDGLALICRECNAEKCRAWYQDNAERKRRLSIEYKARQSELAEMASSDTENNEGKRILPPLNPRLARQEVKRAEQIEATSEFEIVRFTPSEGAFCDSQAQGMGVTRAAYVRALVRDALYQSRRETAVIAWIVPTSDPAKAVRVMQDSEGAWQGEIIDKPAMPAADAKPVYRPAHVAARATVKQIDGLTIGNPLGWRLETFPQSDEQTKKVE